MWIKLPFLLSFRIKLDFLFHLRHVLAGLALQYVSYAGVKNLTPEPLEKKLNIRNDEIIQFGIKLSLKGSLITEATEAALWTTVKCFHTIKR